MKESVKYYNTELYRKAIKMFRRGMTRKEIAEKLNLKYQTVIYWMVGRDKDIETHKANRQKKLRRKREPAKRKMTQKLYLARLRLLRDYSTGKYNIVQLSKRYGVDRRTAMKWKKEVYGNVPIRKMRMFQMKVAGIPTITIADFYDITMIGAAKAIREYREYMAKNHGSFDIVRYVPMYHKII